MKIKFYENHAQDTRVKQIKGGGMSNNRITRSKLARLDRQQPNRTETEMTIQMPITKSKMLDALRWNNRTSPHQQDQWNWMGGVARTLATATHGAGSLLTKTLIVTSKKAI